MGEAEIKTSIELLEGSSISAMVDPEVAENRKEFIAVVFLDLQSPIQFPIRSDFVSTGFKTHDSTIFAPPPCEHHHTTTSPSPSSASHFFSTQKHTSQMLAFLPAPAPAPSPDLLLAYRGFHGVLHTGTLGLGYAECVGLPTRELYLGHFFSWTLLLFSGLLNCGHHTIRLVATGLAFI